MQKIPSVQRLLLALLLSFFALSAQAALPALDSQGQPLPSLAPMLKHVMPGVVNISTTTHIQVQENPLFSDPFFRHFFDVPEQPQQQREAQSLGSGVIVDAGKGLILTNNHVIDKADEITVTLQDGRQLEAKLVGTDPETDIAVVKVKGDHLQQVPIGDSSKLQVGDFAVAIGNPFGLGQTVTSGIVSALGRSGLGIEGYEDFIQTDASINPGNSGGALVNLRGELVGINTAILSRSGGNIGIGFAIPIDMAREVMDQLIKYGEVHRGRLGVQAQDLTPQLAKAFGIDFRRGAVITQVTPESAGDKAGLKTGDVIIAVDGQPVRDASMVRNRIGLLRVGEKVELTVLRDGNKRTVTARIQAEKHARADGEHVHPKLTGAQLGAIPENSPLHGQVQGVMVLGVEPGSAAAHAGLRKGDVIVSANRQPVSSVDELRQAVAGSNSLLLNIQRGRAALFLFIQ